MIKLGYILRDSKAEESLVYLCVYINKKRELRYNIDLRIKTAIYEKGRTPSDPEVNQILMRTETEVYDWIRKYKNDNKAEPTPTKIKKFLDEEYFGKKTKEKLSFFDAYKKIFIEDPDIEEDTKKNRKFSKKVISDFNKLTEFEDVNTTYLSDFTDYMLAKGFTVSSVRVVIATLKGFMRKALSDGLHENRSFLDFSRRLKKSDDEKKESNKKRFALTIAQKNDLEKKKLTGSEAIARDLWMALFYTACRYVDREQIRPENVKDGHLYIEQKKTGQTAKVPVKKPLLELWEKYGGRIPEMSVQRLNEHLKEIAKRVKSIKEAGYAEYFSSHNARRSMATVLENGGMTYNQIRQITGHKSTASLIIYLRGADIETVNQISEKMDTIKGLY